MHDPQVWALHPLHHLYLSILVKWHLHAPFLPGWLPAKEASEVCQDDSYIASHWFLQSTGLNKMWIFFSPVNVLNHTGQPWKHCNLLCLVHFDMPVCLKCEWYLIVPLACMAAHIVTCNMPHSNSLLLYPQKPSEDPPSPHEATLLQHPSTMNHLVLLHLVLVYKAASLHLYSIIELCFTSISWVQYWG